MRMSFTPIGEARMPEEKCCTEVITFGLGTAPVVKTLPCSKHR